MPRPITVVLLLALAVACQGGGGGGPPACPGGEERCGDACVDLQASAAHCGSCSTACSPTQACLVGACGCAGGTTACGTTCVDVQTSAAHCGSCANACPAGAACAAGTCQAVCTLPEVACGLSCADLSTSAANCGRCGRACATGAACTAGACAAAACTGLLDVPGAPLLPIGGTAMAAGDLDGNGTPDIVAVDNATVAVALASGGGRFASTPPLALPPGSWASGVVLARLDGDAHLDVAVADRTGFVHVAMGLGDGTFGPLASYAAGSGSGADGIAVADLDGDGHIDLAVSYQGGYPFTYLGGVAVLLNRGDGTFLAPTFLPAGISTSAIAAGDANGDGLPDLVAANRYGHPSSANVGDASLFLGKGAGVLDVEIPIATGGAPQAIGLADLDGDGRLDLVTSAAGIGTSVQLGHGDGTFGPPVAYASGSDDLALADLNGDGHPDVALASGALLLNRGDGTGTLTATSIGAATSATSGVAAADLDGDGLADLAYGSGLVALRLADGSYSVPFSLSAGWPLDVGDVNGDLDPDVVVSDLSGSGRLVALLGRGDGTFVESTPVTLPPGSVVRLGRLADVDGDGRLDLVTFDGVTVAVWLGDGAGGFAAGPSFTPATPIVDLLALDLDGDGRAELVTRDAPAMADSGSAVLVRHGRGDGTFDPPATLAVDATALAAADLDGNGSPDLLVGSRNGLSVDILLDAGNGTFAPPVSSVVGDVVTGIAVGDLDGDGVPDVVAASNPYGFPARSFLATLLGLGGGALGAPVRFAAGMAPTAPLLGDLDGDGRADLLYLPEYGSRLLLLRNAGNGTFLAPQPVALWESPVAVADFDRDGRPDVLARGTVDTALLLRTRCRP